MVGHSSTFYNVLPVQILPPLARPASAVSASVDMQNYDSVEFVLGVGAAGDTYSANNRIEASLQESSDNVTFTQVADSDMQRVVAGETQAGTFMILNANAGAGLLYRTAYTGNQRYVRVALTNYGTTANGTPMVALALLGRPRNAPVIG